MNRAADIVATRFTEKRYQSNTSEIHYLNITRKTRKLK